MAQSDVWYYAANGESKGPFSEAQLRDLVANRSIGEDPLVWSEEIGQWRPFSETRLGSASARGYDGAGAARSTPGVHLERRGETGWRPTEAPTTFGASIRSFFSKYATFSGRSNRPEFWWPVLFALLLGIVTGVVDYMLVGAHSGLQPVSTLAQLALLIPSFAVGVRRLHDTDRSGWWYFIVLLPIVGAIVLLVFFLQKGTETANRFG